jgi:uroporphyrinogen-III synthase
MQARTPTQPPGWYVISLRPRGGHDALRRAATRHGAGLIALSPWALKRRDDDEAGKSLKSALAAPKVVFTSPAAVSAAKALQPLRMRPHQQWFAVGAGTAAALRRAGIAQVQAPHRMDSEGLLALPGLADVAGTDVGFVSAPGGRGVLVPSLQARGARIRRADVYERIPVTPSPRAVAQLQALSAPAVLALSSGEALQRMLDALPATALATLRRAKVVAASERLADFAREHGFDEVVVAQGPRPADLLAAAAKART